MQNSAAPIMPKKKSRFAFLRKPRFLIPAVIVVLGGGWFLFGRGGNKGPVYETAAVVRGDIQQTVEVTGEIKPDARLNLAFKSGGTLQAINVKVGQEVKVGDVLAELEDRDLRFASQRAHAALAIAQANLSARLAGATKEDIAIAQAQVNQAQADLDATRQNVQNELRIAELALQKAKSDFETNGATSDQTVSAAYANLRSALQGAVGPMRSGLIEGDAEIGVDNTSANDSYESVLGIYARDALELAKQNYPQAKLAVNTADAAVRNVTSTTSNADLLQVGDLVQDALRKTQLYLDEVQKVLAGTITNASLTDAQLSAKKAGIDSARAAVSAQLTSVTSYVESARSSGISQSGSKETLQIALDTAQANYEIAKSNVVTKVQTAESNLAIQQANLDSRTAPPRAVDVEGLRAQVLDAQTAAQQADEKLSDVQIVAPVDGVVTDIVPNRGELVAANVTAINLVTKSKFTVDALVPEADIAKVAPSQPAEITLDAYGDTVKFAGAVIAEDPDQTKVSDAIYYKTTLSIDSGDRDVKPGMTANVTIDTGDRTNALIIPTRAIRESNGVYTVRVIEGGTPREVTVTIGLRGDDGKTEALSGVSEGMQIVTGETGTP